MSDKPAAGPAERDEQARTVDSGCNWCGGPSHREMSVCIQYQKERIAELDLEVNIVEDRGDQMTIKQNLALFFLALTLGAVALEVMTVLVTGHLC